MNLTDLIPRPNNPVVDLTIRDFKVDSAAGKATLYFDAANAAAKMICGLYGKSPASLVRIIPAGAGLIDNSRGIFDDLCQNIAPPPPPPTVRFPGGQCDNVRYNWTLTATLNAGYTNGVKAPDRTQVFTGQMWGTIQSVELADFQDITSGPFRYVGFSRIEALCRGQDGLPTATTVLSTMLGSSSHEIQSFSGISFVRTDGNPDTCGNSVPAYPPPSATVPDVSNTTLVHINPTTTISVPVNFIPTVVINPGTFRPEFNINVGGINVNISEGGFTFSPTLEIPVNVPLPYSDPRTSPPTPIPVTNPNAGGGGTPTDLTPIIDRLRRIEQEVVDCCEKDLPFVPPIGSRLISTVLGSGASGTYVLPARVFKVEVVITSRPAKEKVQYGTLSPDVIFAGWAWFGVGGKLSERMTIDAVSKAFAPKEWISDSFNFSLYTGYVATVTAFSTTPPPAVP